MRRRGRKKLLTYAFTYAIIIMTYKISSFYYEIPIVKNSWVTDTFRRQSYKDASIYTEKYKSEMEDEKLTP